MMIWSATVLEDGEAIGTVSEVSNFGASDLIEITPKGGVPYYFPFTDESVASVDLNAGTLSVTGSEAFAFEWPCAAATSSITNSDALR